MNVKVNRDAMGIAVSIACAVHCAVLPLLFTSLPLFGINIIHSFLFETIMVSAAFIIGAYSLYHGYKKHHHNFLPIIVFASGFVFLILKLIYIQYENWLLIPGVSGIIYAHVINYKACRLHNHAHKDDCDH